MLISNNIKNILIQDKNITEVKYTDKTVWKPPVLSKIMTAVIDQNNPNPLECITYEDDAKGMTKGSPEWDKFFGTKLVLFKDGKEVRELKDEELNSLSPDDGDVMAKFSRKGLNIRTVDNKVYVSMTDSPNSPDFKYYAHSRGEEARDAFYLGAYLGVLGDNDKIRSTTNGWVPAQYKIGEYRTMAQANGTGYEIMAFYQWMFIQSMYVLKYGNLDSQTAIGKGMTGKLYNPRTGSTNGKGIDYGTNRESEHVRFQYLETIWGQDAQILDGVAYKNKGTLFTTTDNFNDTATNYKSYNLGFDYMHGYPKIVQGTSELGFLIKDDTYSITASYCDEQTLDSIFTELYVLTVGGGKEYMDNAGIFFVNSVPVDLSECCVRLMFL